MCNEFARGLPFGTMLKLQDLQELAANSRAGKVGRITHDGKREPSQDRWAELTFLNIRLILRM